MRGKASEVECYGCGTKFMTAPVRNQKYCSRACYQKPLQMCKCKNPACGKTFKPHTRQSQKYCSNPCYWSDKTATPVTRQCANCEKPFTLPSWRPSQTFCSRPCRYDHLHKHSRKAFTVETAR